MSDKPQPTQEELDQMLAKQREHVAQLEANRTAVDAYWKAYEAARAEAERQKQKDLIKEAIIEALNGPVKLRASTADLVAVMQAADYRLPTSRAADIKVEFLKPADKYKLGGVRQGYFARLWAALRSKLPACWQSPAIFYGRAART